jgi:hypothetical protein
VAPRCTNAVADAQSLFYIQMPQTEKRKLH